MIIYKITNAFNGKAFIGLSSHDLETTRNLFYIGQIATSNSLMADVLKADFDAFVWELLLEDPSQSDLARLIKEHNTCDPEEGYNLPNNSPIYRKPKPKPKKKRKPRSEATKAKISQTMTGKPKSESHKLAMSRGHATHKESGLFYQDPAYKAKISAALKGKIKRTPAQCAKYREAALTRWYGSYRGGY